MSDTIEWRWADVDGRQHGVSFEELSETLASGSLPAFTLVWRSGWTEWLAAENVPELTAALGIDNTGPPSVVRVNPAARTPPPVPVNRYTAHFAEKPRTLLGAGKQPGAADVAQAAPKQPPPPKRPGAGPPPPPRPPGGAGAGPPRVQGLGAKPAAPPARPSGEATPPPPPVVEPASPPAQAAPAAPIRGAPIQVPPPPEFMSAPVPIRDVMPTLADAEPVRSPTLRPVGALPPPPRTLPTPKVPEFRTEDDDVESADSLPPAPAALPRAAAKTITGLAPPAMPPEAALVPPPMPAAPAGTPSAPTALAAPPAPGPAVAPPPMPPEARSGALAAKLPSDGTAPASLSEQTLAPLAAPPPGPATPRRLPPASGGGARAGTSRHTITVATAASLLLPGTLLLVAALLKPSSKASSDPTPAVSASAAPARKAAPPPPPACGVDRSAQRIAEAAFVGVPPLFAADGDRAALGFAGAKDRMVGLLLDPSTLEVAPVVDRQVKGGILGVVPLVGAGKLEFAVDLTDKKLRSARTVDGAMPFTLGVTDAGFSRSSTGGMNVLWPGRADDPTITTPRVTKAPGTGYAVAFRHGGQAGKILLGWLDELGNRKTDLKAVGTDATILGTPTVAVNEKSVLLAFAAKAAAEEPWRVELGKSSVGAGPERASALQVPAGGPGGDAMSPAVEGLPGGRFLLQWTEGSAGNRAVRVVTLSADLVPVGEPATLSSSDQNAGQGALWVRGNRAVALFLVKGAGAHELWGASLKCP